MSTRKNLLLDAAALAVLLGVYEWHRGRRIPGVKLSRKCLRFDPGDVLRAVKKGKADESLTR
jgi:hypothetical protein